MHKSKTKSKKSKITTPARPVTGLHSLELFRQGKTVAEIAEERELSVQTIYNHLHGFLPGGDIRLDELIDMSKVPAIREAIKLHGTVSLRTLKDELGEVYEYHEIRAVIEADKSGRLL